MDPVIALRGVVSVLGRFPALAGVDLDVFAGEIVLLAGPNGAGKTTLLRLCAGLENPARGTATVLGLALPAQRRELRRRVGYLGHVNGLYDDLSVEQNVRFWARAAGVQRPDVGAALAAVKLEPRLLRVAVGSLSAGQRRRVALASVAVRRPELWLLDEPHAGLDASGRDLLDALLRRATASGATVVVASHELERVVGLATRVVTVASGAAEQAAAEQGAAEQGAAGQSEVPEPVDVA